MFKKGQSGNPKGRKPMTESIAELIRRQTKGGTVLMAHAMKLLESDSESVRLDVIRFLTERGWGKAPQPIEHSGDVGSRMILVFPEPEAKKE